MTLCFRRNIHPSICESWNVSTLPRPQHAESLQRISKPNGVQGAPRGALAGRRSASHDGVEPGTPDGGPPARSRQNLTSGSSAQRNHTSQRNATHPPPSPPKPCADRRSRPRPATPPMAQTVLPLRIARPLQRQCVGARSSTGVRGLSSTASLQAYRQLGKRADAELPSKAPSTVHAEQVADIRKGVQDDLGLLPGMCGWGS